MADNYLITGYHGTPHVTTENDRGINAAMFGIGRFVLPVGEQFRAEYIGNNTIRMYDGKLMDNGAAVGIPVGSYVDFSIANAGQGMKRNDLIVFQYQQDASTLIESGTFVIVQGEESSGAASDPALTQEDLLSGEAAFDQMALWRVSVSGATISAPVQLFSVDSPNVQLDAHASNKSNPHGVTASQVGARPDTWMPTAEEVGATPASHASNTSNPHNVTASQVGAVPTTRTVNGKALSANITLGYGDVGAAPLIPIGTYSGDLNSLDIQVNSIAWIKAGGCTNCPTGNYAILETWGSPGNGARIQRITTITGPAAQRVLYNGSTWTEWEWDSPPMTVGVEYRTIERWNTNPIYAKIINCGTLVDGRKLVEDSNLGGCVVVEAKGYVSQGSNNYYQIPSIYDTTDANNSVVTTVNTTSTSGNIHIWGGSEFVGKTAYVMVKYFKP